MEGVVPMAEGWDEVISKVPPHPAPFQDSVFKTWKLLGLFGFGTWIFPPSDPSLGSPVPLALRSVSGGDAALPQHPSVSRKVVGAVRRIKCGPQAPGEMSELSSGGRAVCMPGLDSVGDCVSCPVCHVPFVTFSGS